MDIREFKKWIIENHFEENDLFQEALICYNNRAYKAAYMFSYLAFTNYMRYLIIDYEGIPLQFKKQWNEKLSKDNKTDCERLYNSISRSRICIFSRKSATFIIDGYSKPFYFYKI